MRPNSEALRKPRRPVRKPSSAPGCRSEAGTCIISPIMHWTVRGRLGCGLAVLILFESACSRRNNPQNNENLLRQHRNLGKAFYENPTTKQEAVQEFQQALALAPDSAREKLNYALALLRASGHDDE